MRDWVELRSRAQWSTGENGRASRSGTRSGFRPGLPYSRVPCHRSYLLRLRTTRRFGDQLAFFEVYKQIYQALEMHNDITH